MCRRLHAGGNDRFGPQRCEGVFIRQSLPVAFVMPQHHPGQEAGEEDNDGGHYDRQPKIQQRVPGCLLLLQLQASDRGRTGACGRGITATGLQEQSVLWEIIVISPMAVAKKAIDASGAA